MIGRILLGLVIMAIAAVPALSPGVAAQNDSSSNTFEFFCFRDGTVRLEGNNTYPDKSIRVTVFSRPGTSSFTNVGSISLGPGESETLAINPSQPATYGWSILVESLGPGEGSLGSYPYPRECFPYSDNDSPGGTIDPTAMLPPAATETPQPTSTPVPNSFKLTAAQRMCADQSFVATWSGANITSLEFSLTNTSDEWTSGWFAADPAAGSITQAVDHHGYNKVMAVAAFEDGTDETVSLNVGTCTEVPAPPAPVDPAPSTGGSSGQAVKSLPSTGTGSGPDSLIVISALALVASTLIVAGSLRNRH